MGRAISVHARAVTTASFGGDVNGNCLCLRPALTAGEAHDDRFLSHLKSESMPLPDLGHAADWIAERIMKNGAWANIPPKRNHIDPICYNPYLYRARGTALRSYQARIRPDMLAARIYSALAPRSIQRIVHWNPRVPGAYTRHVPKSWK